MSWIIYRMNCLQKRVLNCRPPRKQSTHNAALQNWHQMGSDTLPDIQQMMPDHPKQKIVNDAPFTVACLSTFVSEPFLKQRLSFSEACKIDASLGSRQLPTGPSFIGRWVEKIYQMQHLKKHVRAKQE